MGEMAQGREVDERHRRMPAAFCFRGASGSASKNAPHQNVGPTGCLLAAGAGLQSLIRAPRP